MELGTTLFQGRYTLDRLLDFGSGQPLYLARDLFMESSVILQILEVDPSATDQAEAIKRRFGRLHALVHQHILGHHALEFDAEAQLFLVVMEYVAGENLARHLQGKAEKTLSQTEALPLLTQVASALDLAHRHQVVHGHLSPTNLLMTAPGGVKLVGFSWQLPSSPGLFQARRHTKKPPEIGGHQAYWAPELLQGNDPSPQSDQYALGVLFLELVTGQALSPAGLATATSLNRRQKETLARALAEQPSTRFATVSDFVSALEMASRPLWQHPNAGVWLAAGVLAAAGLTWFLGERGLPTAMPRTDVAKAQLAPPAAPPVTSPAPRSPAAGEDQKGTAPSLSSEVKPVTPTSGESPLSAPESRRLQELQAQAEAAMAANRLTMPPGRNALESLREAMTLDGENTRTRALIDQLATLIANLAADDIEASRLVGQSGSTALEKLDRIRSLAPKHPRVYEVSQHLIERLLQLAEEDFKTDRLSSPANANALQRFRAVLKLEPQNTQALNGLERIAERYIRLSLKSADNGGALLDQGRQVLGDAEKFETMVTRLSEQDRQEQELKQRQQKIEQLLTQGKNHLLAKRLTQPAGSNALESFREVLALESDNASAKEGLEKVFETLLELASSETSRPDMRESYLKKAEEILPQDPRLVAAKGSFSSPGATSNLSPDLLRQLQEIDAHLEAGRLTNPAGRNALEAINTLGTSASTLPELSQRRDRLVNQLLELANQDLQEQRLTQPAGRCALDRFALVLHLLPQQPQALEGLDKAIKALLVLAEEDLAQDRLTSPTGRNALEKYRKILSLSPEHGQTRTAMAQLVEQLLQKAREDLKNDRLSPKDGSGSLAKFRSILEIVPDHAQAKEGIEETAFRLMELADKPGLPSKTAQEMRHKAQEAVGNAERLAVLNKRLEEARTTRAAAERQERIQDLLAKGQTNLEEGRLTNPPGRNALERFRQVLEIDPQQAQAKAGLEGLFTRLMEMADKSNNPREQAELRAKAEQILPGDQRLAPTKAETTPPPAEAPPEAPRLSAGVDNPELKTLLTKAENHLLALRLVAPPGNNALEIFQSIQNRYPNSPLAKKGLGLIVERLVELALQGETVNTKAADYLEEAEEILPGDARIKQARLALEKKREDQQQRIKDATIRSLVESAEIDIQAGRFTSPQGNNALEKYNEISRMNPGNPAAQSGLDHMVKTLIGLAREHGTNLEQANSYLDTAEQILPEDPRITSARKRLSEPPTAAPKTPENATTPPSPRPENNGKSNGAGKPNSREWQDPTTGMSFLWIPGGCYQMGAEGFDPDEKPLHEVCVKGFWMGKYEVTQGEWQSVMGTNPSTFKKGNNFPVEMVSWYDVRSFVEALEQRTHQTFRLPTEAEWEFACRSGGRNEIFAGSQEPGNVAWYEEGNTEQSTHPVGTKGPNGLGLYDMSGNVYEWVADWYDPLFYGNGQKDNPVSTDKSSNYVILRGGSWINDDDHVRCTNRDWLKPDYWYDVIGLRLVRMGPPPAP
ncbi:MAG: SUMF1/EgtB/PvdO family nonheme iron enzyme [Magnetococcales bacterium]|nr:SUMF1/EgtB/PvdO family nonheme iron enzyme [Magnetococcales bacterium]